MSDDYECEMCHGVFAKAQSDEEAEAESVRLFGVVEPEDLALICDDCFVKVTAYDAAGEPEQ